MRPCFVAALLAVCAVIEPAVAATLYRAGDVVEDFVLINRTTREPLRLSDFAGKIVFIEWFAWWCPFCQLAAPQVENGIVQYYDERGGNPNGIPVVHVAVNLQANQETQTQNFITKSGFELVAEDFNRALASRFQSGGQPIFAIVNGVTDSPSHRPWELLLHRSGYLQTASPIEEFRAAIDAVKAPVKPTRLGPPKRRTDGSWEIPIEAAPGQRYRLEVSTDLKTWLRAPASADPGTPGQLRDPGPGPAPQRFYRVATE